MFLNEFAFVNLSIIKIITSCSDHIALLKAFEGWKEAKRNGKERAFCWENFLSPVTLQMMEDMRMQFLDLLSGIGFVDKSRGPAVSTSLVKKNIYLFFFLTPFNLPGQFLCLFK